MARVSANNSSEGFARRMEEALMEKVGLQRYQLWFQNHVVFSWPKQGPLQIFTQTAQFQDWLEHSFGEIIREVSSEISNGVVIQYLVNPGLFTTESAKPKSETETPPKAKPKPNKGTRSTLFGEEVLPPGPSRPSKAKAKPSDDDEPAPTISSKSYAGRRWKSLPDFVVGSCNRVAYAAAMSVVDEPGDGPNPLVIHGPVGTGKTHLLEGIFQGLKKQKADQRPCYITAEEFTTRFVQASRFDKHANFRRQFRECSALLLDDLHFLTTKIGTQKEFIHTLDSLIADGRPVVLTTDVHPRLAEELLPELVDRLVGGAAWALQPPDDKTRLDILRKKASLASPMLPEPVLKYLASHLSGNVRELEGAVNSVRHYAKVTQQPVDIVLVREALGELLRHTIRVNTLKDVDHAVCTVMRIPHGSLQSKARTWSISHPRMIAMYLGRKHTAATYGEVAKYFGVKTHSTVVAAEKKVRTWLQQKATLSVAEREWRVPDLITLVERELQR